MSKNKTIVCLVALILSVMFCSTGCQSQFNPFTLINPSKSDIKSTVQVSESISDASNKTDQDQADTQETPTQTAAKKAAKNNELTQPFQSFIKEIIADPNRLYYYLADYYNDGIFIKNRPYSLDPNADFEKYNVLIYPIAPGHNGTGTWLFYKEYDPDQYGKIMKGKIYPANQYHDTLLLVTVPETKSETNHKYAPNAHYGGGGPEYDHLYFVYDKHSKQIKMIGVNNLNPVDINGQLIIKKVRGPFDDHIITHQLATVDDKWQIIDKHEFSINRENDPKVKWSDVDTTIVVNGVKVDVCSDDFVAQSEAEITEDLESLLDE